MFGYLLRNWVVFLLLTKFIKLMRLNAPKKVIFLSYQKTRFRLKRKKTHFFLSTFDHLFQNRVTYYY